jgi:hypothetical protein
MRQKKSDVIERKPTSNKASHPNLAAYLKMRRVSTTRPPSSPANNKQELA